MFVGGLSLKMNFAAHEFTIIHRLLFSLRPKAENKSVGSFFCDRLSYVGLRTESKLDHRLCDISKYPVVVQTIDMVARWNWRSWALQWKKRTSQWRQVCFCRSLLLCLPLCFPTVWMEVKTSKKREGRVSQWNSETVWGSEEQSEATTVSRIRDIKPAVTDGRSDTATCEAHKHELCRHIFKSHS